MDLSEHEYAECTPNLRWVERIEILDPPRGIGNVHRVLQQGWRIVVRDTDGTAMGSRIEWVDVPVTKETR